MNAPYVNAPHSHPTSLTSPPWSPPLPSPAPSVPAAIRGSRSIRSGIALLPPAPATEHSHQLGVVA